MASLADNNKTFKLSYFQRFSPSGMNCDWSSVEGTYKPISHLNTGKYPWNQIWILSGVGLSQHMFHAKVECLFVMLSHMKVNRLFDKVRGGDFHHNNMFCELEN